MGLSKFFFHFSWMDPWRVGFNLVKTKKNRSWEFREVGALTLDVGLPTFVLEKFQIFSRRLCVTDEWA
jgi:hypothetical protein